MQEIIGREKEIQVLNKILSSGKAELIALYGRRRVGKTFLINEYLSDKGIYLECTGVKDGNLSDQLKNFICAFQATFYPNLSLSTPKSWRDAFELLTSKINEISEDIKIIIFFDELPWLASRKSKFLQQFDYFWNTKWSRKPNIKLIVCGSAASWILDNLINAKGGLYNRITQTIRLDPFSLGETKQFLQNRGVKLTLEQVLDLYMVIGGIPFYLNQIDKNKSITQNINDLCFTENGLLYSEFSRLFKALFDAYELNVRIINVIAKFRYGISYKTILKKVGKTAGGRFNQRLHELEASGFIKKFIPYGKTRRDSYYCINDEYIMFYLKWIDGVKTKIPKNGNYWLKTMNSAAWHSWAGFAFEIVCVKHAHKIINALGLSQVGCLIGSWKNIPENGEEEQGAQIDLLLDRDDNAITICEIKYSSEQFVIDKAYAKNLMNKQHVFQKIMKVEKHVFLAIITTSGLKKNLWSEELVSGVVELKDLIQ